MAEAGSVTIRAILDASDLLKKAKQIENELKGLGNGTFSALDQEADKAADSVGKVGDEAEKASSQIDQTNKSASGAGDALRVGLAGAAAAAGAAILATASDYDSAQARMQAALNLSSEEAERFRVIGTGIYEDGWGQSLDQVTDALIQTKSTIRDVDEQGLDTITRNALALSEAFGADVNETIRGTNALMEGFGLTADEASDLMAAGMQRGLNYTDELGDNLSEYAGRWGDAGMSASEYFSLLEAGTANGAYNLDKVGDFLNEFLTSLSDGRMEENIGRLSDGTQQVFENFKAGKATAEDVLNAVIGDLSSMTDETERASFASDVWSSLGEDNAMKMILAMGNVEDTFTDVAGASEDVADTMSESFASKAQSAARTLLGSLEDLGDPLLNIAEYGAELISTFAEWFSSMDEGGQRAVVTAAAVVAAIGPVSRGVSAVATATEGVVNVAKTAAGVVSDLAGGMGDLGSKSDDAGKKGRGAAGSFASLASSLSPMGLAVTAVAGGLVVIGASFVKAAQDAAEFDKATQGLEDVVNGTSTALQGAGNSLDDYSAKADNAALSVDELRQKQAAWVDTLAERDGDLNASIGLLDNYRDTIERLAGQTDLTTTEQAQLSAAVDGVNDACGTTLEVAQDAGGAYQVMSEGAAMAKDEVLKLIDAQKAQAMADVYQEDYEEAYRQEAEAADTLTEALNRQKAAQDKVNEAQSAGWSTDMLAQYQYELDQANADLAEAQGLYDSAAGALEGYSDKMTIAQMAMEGLDGGYASFIANNSLLQSAITQNGYSLETFRSQLEQSGVSIETLNTLSTEQLTMLATSYDGTLSSIDGLLTSFDGNMATHAQTMMTTIDGAFGYTSMQLQQMATNFGIQGDAGMAAYATAIQNGTPPALAALSVTTGQSVQQFQDVATQAGIKSNEAMEAYATAIQNGYEPTYAALSAVTGMQAQELQDAANDAGVKADDAMNNYVNGINAGYSPTLSAVAAVRNVTVSELQDAANQAGIKGDEAMNRYVSNLRSGYSPTLSATAAVKNVTVDQLGQAATSAGFKGSDVANRYASSISNGSWRARSAGSSVASWANSGIGSYNGSAGTSGSHFAQNFAAGIRGAVSWVRNAASWVAQQARNILGFSVPKEGPWSGAERGGETSGEHLVQNFARGVASAAPQLAEASTQAMTLAADAFSRPLQIANDKAGWVSTPAPANYSYGGSTTNNSKKVVVNMTINATIREEADVERLSREIAKAIERED